MYLMRIAACGNCSVLLTLKERHIFIEWPVQTNSTFLLSGLCRQNSAVIFSSNTCIQPDYIYISLITLRNARSPLNLNGEQAFLRVNRFYWLLQKARINHSIVLHDRRTIRARYFLCYFCIMNCCCRLTYETACKIPSLNLFNIPNSGYETFSRTRIYALIIKNIAFVEGSVRASSLLKRDTMSRPLAN